MKSIISASLQDTEVIARQIMDQLPSSQQIICLSGDLGSGKTTLAQGMLRHCGAQGPYTSPTFTIMKEYAIAWKERNKIYHIDAYRITSSDMVELGWQEIIGDVRHVVIVEWPENIADIVPQNALHIICAWTNDITRTYTINT